MKKMSLSQLSFIKERISDELKKNYIGGGYGTIDSPYKWNEYQDFLYNGNSSLPAFYFDETDSRQRHEGHSFGADPNWHQDGYPLNVDLSTYLKVKGAIFTGGSVMGEDGQIVLGRKDAIALVKSLYSGGSDNGKEKIIDTNNIIGNIESYFDKNISALEEAWKTHGGKLLGFTKEKKDELLAVYNRCKGIIDWMKNDSNLNFRIQTIVNNNDHRYDAETSYDAETNTVVISTESFDSYDEANISVIAHEIVHIGQIRDNKLYIKDGDIRGYDMKDEVEAYKIQHLIRYGINSGKYDLRGNKYEKGDYKVTKKEILKAFPDLYKNL